MLACSRKIPCLLEVGKPFNLFISNFPLPQASLKWDEPKYQGVDILLTSDWPKGITNNAARLEAVDDLSKCCPCLPTTTNHTHCPCRCGLSPGVQAGAPVQA